LRLYSDRSSNFYYTLGWVRRALDQFTDKGVGASTGKAESNIILLRFLGTFYEIVKYGKEDFAPVEYVA
jgi:hypothetical protein